MIDKIDRILLDHLFAYSRFTTKQLAKATGLTQQAISYRIKNLEKRKLILKYDAIANWNSLPLIKTLYYIRTTSQKDLISQIKGEKSIFGLNTVIGKYNLLVWCFFRTRKEKKDFEKKLKGNKVESLEADEVFFPQVSIFNTSLKLNVPKKSRKYIRIDKKDIKIMKYLSEGHSRDSVAEIGENLGIDYDVVYYRLKKLIKSNYFFRFAAQVGWNSLDLRLSALRIKLKDKNRIGKIIKELLSLDFFAAIVTDNKRDAHLHIFSENTDQYWNRIKKISEIIGEDLESLENIHFDETIILNRYPLEYLLDPKIKKRIKHL